jgi:ABC-type antimicrobial peptide transport system permease subunit
MIGHIFKLIWIEKKSFCGIFIEQAMVVCILMFCMIRLAVTVQKYTDPGLLDTHSTFAFNVAVAQNLPQEIQSDIYQNMAAIVGNLRKQSFVEAITASYKMTPYLGSGDWSDSLFIDNKKIKVNIMGSDEYGIAVFHPVLKEGVWITDKLREDGTFPIVITKQFAEKAEWNHPLGKKIQFNTYTYTVVGMVEGLKHNLFEPSTAAMIVPLNTIENTGEFVARVKKKEEGTFTNVFYREINRLMADHKDNVVLIPMDMVKQTRMFSTLMGLILVCIPAFFLSIFAFMGIFGLFNLHIKKNFREFALRIALGSTKKKLMLLVIFKSLSVTCLAMLPMLLISFFLYDYASIIQLTAILVTICIMLIFSFISAWYPAWKISQVSPAKALKYE